MAAHLGVVALNGLSAPVGGYVQESSKEETIEIATIRDAAGVTKVAVAKPMVTRTVMIKGKGDAGLASVAAGGFTANTVRITEAKQTETNDDFPDFEITGTAYTDLA
ncbi:hypothetical protein EBZ39_18145 [bacterium]|nr:hypothetical protein [bacterium]